MNNSSFNLKRVPNDAYIELLGTRVVLFRASGFAYFRKMMEPILGPETDAFFYEAGLLSGRNSVEARLTTWKEKDLAFLQKFITLHSSIGLGWFKLEDQNLDLNTGGGIIRITKSFFAETYGKSTKPVCDFLAGYFVGVLEEVVGKQLTGEETTCIAKGDPVCTFKIEPVE